MITVTSLGLRMAHTVSKTGWRQGRYMDAATTVHRWSGRDNLFMDDASYGVTTRSGLGLSGVGVFPWTTTTRWLGTIFSFENMTPETGTKRKHAPIKSRLRW